MLKLEFDFKQLEQQALKVGAAADQIPYALSLAMNKAADITRQYLIKQTWPGHIHQRNASFIAASLTTRESRATKGSLAVEIYDKLDRGNLQLQAKGGTRTARSGNLAIPSSNITRGSRGVPKRLRPRTLAGQLIEKKDLLLLPDKRKGKRGRLRLMYVLKKATRVPKRVPFYEDFAAVMNRELRRLIPDAVRHAMATRRR
jgi:hypothetical protein